MRVLIYILLAVSSELWAVSHEQKLQNAHGSQLETQSPMTVEHYENQIRLADSLYKNYLPQYNFEEVKAAVGFFDSLRLTTDNSQQTLCNSDAYPRTVDCCPLTVDIEFLCARAHYYHAVGLSEHDDIVGACEHYLTALEIMEFETENLRTSKSEKRSQSRKVARSQSDCLSDSATQIPCDPETQIPCDLNKEDYEKIRFLALTYNRLGRLFYNEAYCDLAILKYKKALEYFEKLGNNEYKANILKEIGNTYQLYSQPDSALYYYNKSLRISSNLTNILDVEKSVAQILFEKGEKDSAYILIKNNLDKIENTNVRYSYYNILGEMYMDDKEYDSAIYYLEKSVISNNNYIKHQSSLILSAIYDSIGKQEKKTYYEEIVSKLSMNMVNKSVIRGEIQDVYDKYKERKAEKEKIKSRTRTKVIAISLSLLVFIAFVIIILIWHKSKRKDRIHQESLNEKDRYIADKEEIISRIDKEIKQKESEIKELVEIIGNLKSDINSLKNEVDTKEEEISCKENDIKKMENDLSAKERELKRLQENVHESRILINKLNENHKTNEERIAVHLEEIEKLKTEINQAQNNLNDLRFKNSFTEGKIKKQNAELKKKEELIGKYTTEISNLKYRLERKRIDVSNLNNYLQSDICSRILNEINELSDKRLKSNMLSPLSKEEFVLLLNSANHHLNYFINDMAKKYPKLKKEDLYYLCFVIMGLDNNQIASLFGVTYDTAKKREKKICVIFDLDPKENLSNYLLHLV